MSCYQPNGTIIKYRFGKKGALVSSGELAQAYHREESHNGGVIRL